MRFANYGVMHARRARRAMKGYGWADQINPPANMFGWADDNSNVPRQLFGSYGDSSGCSAGYSADANGNCVNSSGAGEGCNGGKVDANGNCLNSDGSAQGCGAGTTVTADGTCLDANGNPITGSSAAAPAASSGSSSVWSDIGSAIGSTAKALTGGSAKPVVASSGSSLLIPGLFVVGAAGLAFFLVKRKK